jgi:hypothetical protein
LSRLTGESDAAIPAIEADLAARRKANTSKANAAAAATRAAAKDSKRTA